MASYTPKQLVPTAYVSNAAANIYKPVALTGVIRTLILNANSAARTVNLGMNTADATDTASKRFLDAYALTQAVPFIFNGWLVADVTTWLTGIASAASAVTVSASGYEYA